MPVVDKDRFYGGIRESYPAHCLPAKLRHRVPDKLLSKKSAAGQICGPELRTLLDCLRRNNYASHSFDITSCRREKKALDDCASREVSKDVADNH